MENRKYPLRERIRPKKFNDFELYLAMEEPIEPNSVEEALNGKDSKNWKIAMQEELKSFEEK